MLEPIIEEGSLVLKYLNGFRFDFKITNLFVTHLKRIRYQLFRVFKRANVNMKL